MALCIDLSGKSAIVTGAGRGIGRAIAVELAKAGSNVCCVSRTKDQIEETASMAKAHGVRAIAVKADISRAQDVKDMVQAAISQFGRVQILVANAGIERASALLEQTEEAWDAVIDTNLKSLFLCVREIGAHMIENRYGKILINASSGGFVAAPRNAAYHASKAGAILFCKSVALEWARYNITVNAIAPGYVDTELMRSLAKNEETLEKYRKAIPMRRFAKPEEIGPLAAFLVSDFASYITGEAVLIDGGLTAT